MTKLLRVVPSPLKTKKWRAVFQDGERKYHRDFGAKGYRDYTLMTDPAEAKVVRDRYRTRHSKEAHNAYDTPGVLALYILWGPSQNMQTNIANYKKVFGI
jgi:hypothetical protein